MWQTVVDDFHKFMHAPFRADMDVFSLFLAIGLVLMLIVLWSRIVSHLGDVI